VQTFLKKTITSVGAFSMPFSNISRILHNYVWNSKAFVFVEAALIMSTIGGRMIESDRKDVGV
jgi:hypothetical protein